MDNLEAEPTAELWKDLRERLPCRQEPCLLQIPSTLDSTLGARARQRARRTSLGEGSKVRHGGPLAACRLPRSRAQSLLSA